MTAAFELYKELAIVNLPNKLPAFGKLVPNIIKKSKIIFFL
jgi:hypothetical protein